MPNYRRLLVPGGCYFFTVNLHDRNSRLQRRYWEHLIADERDLETHIDYCWFNPVKHGLVANVEDWPYSSFHREHRDAPGPGDFERAFASPFIGASYRSAPAAT